MAIIAKQNKTDYTPAPEGLWMAVCCDVVDIGEQPTQWGPKHMIKIRWQLEEADSKTGRPFYVSRRFGLSLGEKSHLRPTLESWRGKKFTADELAGFDLENLIGACCQVQVIHNVKEGGEVYANVQAVVPFPRNMAKLRIGDSYVREVDRPKEATNGNAHNGYGGHDPVVSDEDIPF